MRSYASVEEIDQEFIKCELELIPVEESNAEDYATKPTDMIYLPAGIIPCDVTVCDGDILEVEHDGNGNVFCVSSKNDEEKSRRLELLRQLKI